jgi:hypothetical protein
MAPRRKGSTRTASSEPSGRSLAPELSPVASAISATTATVAVCSWA